METKFDGQMDNFKMVLMAVLLAGACFLTYFFHEILETGTVFTHFFYIPIILASIWWKRKGLSVAIFLAIFLVLSHNFLRDHVTTANDYFRAFMFVVIAFVVAILAEKIAEAQEKASHLNAVLRAIRNVNQLIVKEKNRANLLKGVCDSLTETRGYDNVWIALFDETGRTVTTAESGLGRDFLPMDERLKSGELTDCGQKALSQPCIVIIKDPLSTCPDCPLSAKYSGKGAMTVRLEYHEKVYGLASASIPADFTEDMEEHALFKEMAGDVAFALYTIELEEERRRADEELMRYRQSLENMVEERTAELQTAIGQLQNEIAERKHAEEKIRELSFAVEQSIDGIAISDLEPKLINMNDAFARMHGYSPKNMIGMKVMDFHSEKEMNKYTGVFNQIKTQGSWSGEIEHTRKDGTLFPTYSSATLLKDAEGNPTGVVGVARDITREKRLQDQLRQSQKMESIGTLAGGIAHDFNNILGAILGNAEIALLHELREGNPARHSIRQVVKAGNRAKNLVQQILAFSRQKEQELKIISVTQIVKEAMNLLRSSLPTTIEIRHKLTAGSDMVLADPGQIHQVIMNLCTNAGHAMREKGGVLEITLQNADSGSRTAESDKSEIQSVIDIAPGTYLKLSVSDTGDGMPPELLERIFDPYFTTKAVGKGTGLGLAVVHGIVKSLDGTINVESEQGKGTTFNVFFPTIESKSEPEIDTHEPIPTGNERILLIDDEEGLVDIGKQMLEGLGYKVTTKTSSIEALDTFRSRPGKFDLVITDMTMPNMTGDKLARELMKIRPDIPVILCTGFSELINEEKAKNIGIRDFVMKPLVMRKIGIMIRRILDE